MKRYKFLSIFTLVLLLLSSCNDFIERSPYDEIQDTEYWQNEEQIRIYSYSFYPAYFVGYGATGLIGGSKFGNGDTFNDDIAWRTDESSSPARGRCRQYRKSVYRRSVRADRRLCNSRRDLQFSAGNDRCIPSVLRDPHQYYGGSFKPSSYDGKLH